MDVCMDRCMEIDRNTSGKDRPRHDVRDCFAKADCGHILAGDCAFEASVRDCRGSYVVVSSDCLDRPSAFHFTEDCEVHTDDDWRGLGVPEYEAIGQEGGGTFRYGECVATDPEADGVATCGTCTVAQWDLF